MMYTGDLVRLREYRKDDLELAKDYVNKAEIKQYIEPGVPFLYTLHNEEQWYEQISPHNEAYNFAIEALDTHQYIGGCGVHNLDYKNGRVEIGVFIGDEAYLGKGYGTDAMKVLVKFIFEQMNIHKIKLEVYSFNQRAQKCYEKVGFKKEAVLKDEIFRNGQYHDIICMSMFKEEYFSKR